MLPLKTNKKSCFISNDLEISTAKSLIFLTYIWASFERKSLIGNLAVPSHLPLTHPEERSNFKVILIANAYISKKIGLFITIRKLYMGGGGILRLQI